MFVLIPVTFQVILAIQLGFDVNRVTSMVKLPGVLGRLDTESANGARDIDVDGARAAAKVLVVAVPNIAVPKLE